MRGTETALRASCHLLAGLWERVETRLLRKCLGFFGISKALWSDKLFLIFYGIDISVGIPSLSVPRKRPFRRRTYAKGGG